LGELRTGSEAKRPKFPLKIARKRQVSGRYISNTIRTGIKREMPSFRRKLAADDVSALTAFLRYIR